MQKNKLLDALAVDANSTSFIDTAHDAGRKKVLFSKEYFQSSITQVALGNLHANEEIPSHSHNSMEEVFFVLTGSGEIKINNEVCKLEPGICVRVPAKANHQLKAFTELEFYYFGVAVSDSII